MANIQPEINDFKSAVYGEEVRDALVSLANKLNTENENLANRLNTDEKILNNDIYIPDTYTLSDGYINTDTDIVDIDNITTNVLYKHAVIDCEQGDLFNITGTGSVTARLFCFIDNSKNVLYRAPRVNGYVCTSANIIAPVNASALVINVRTDASYQIIKRDATYSPNPIINDVFSYVPGGKINCWIPKMYIPTNTSVIDFNTITHSNAWRTAIVPVHPGDSFTLSAYGSITARLFCFIDDNYNSLLTASSGNIIYDELTVVAPNNSKYLILNDRIAEEPARDSYKGLKSNSDLYDDLYSLFGYFYGLTPIKLSTGGYFDPLMTDWRSNLTPSKNWTYAFLDVSPGDEFFIKGNGATTAKLFTFFDDNDTPISYPYVVDGTTNTGDGLVRIVAPDEASSLLFQSHIAYNPIIFKKNKTSYLNKRDISYDPSTNLNSAYYTILDEHAYEHGTYTVNGLKQFDKNAVRSIGFLPDHSYAVNIKKHTVPINFVFMGFDDNNNIVHEFISPSTPGNYIYPLNEKLKYKVRGRYSNSSDNNDVDMIKVFGNKLTVMHRTPVRKNSELIDFKNKIEELLTYNYTTEYANTDKPLNILNYYGNIQNVHPKVLYIPDGFAGHKWWMAYTPYTWGKDLYEDPCVVWSDNGLDWFPDYVTPITTEHNTDEDRWNYSDTHIVLVPKDGTTVMQCWWRGHKRSPGHELIYMCESYDGLTWGDIHTIWDKPREGATMMSPTIIYEDDLYKCWVVNNNTSIDYFEGSTPFTMNKIASITDIFYFNYNEIRYKTWHIDIIHDNDVYIMVNMGKSVDTDTELRTLFICESEDGIHWSTPEICVKDRPDKWDQCLYRSSIVRVRSELWLYYSAHTRNGLYNIGLSKAREGYKFVGVL